MSFTTRLVMTLIAAIPAVISIIGCISCRVWEPMMNERKEK